MSGAIITCRGSAVGRDGAVVLVAAAATPAGASAAAAFRPVACHITKTSVITRPESQRKEQLT